MPFWRFVIIKTSGDLGRYWTHATRGTNPGVLPCRRCLHNTPPAQSSPLRDPENRGKSQHGVNFDTLGSWNNRLELGIDVEQSIKSGKLIPKLRLQNVGSASMMGRRKYNEDRYVVSELTPEVQMFALFDGHGGADAVEYTSTHMEEHIRFWLERGETKLQDVITKSFIEINNTFTRNKQRVSSAGEQALSSGTTATVCLLRNSVELVVGHVGDSRATICRRGRYLPLTSDHQPERPQEKKRIEDMGGTITTTSLGRPRVMGRLDMTRSIGDIELKQYGVIAEPETRSLEIRHTDDAFLLLTTDGVHYVINEQELVNIISAMNDAQEAANLITDQALCYGSEDNCTALVVPFGAWGKYATSTSDIQFSFSRNVISPRYG